MPEYRRKFRPGGMFFFTVVTQMRRRLFAREQGRSCLRRAIRQVQARRPFELTAMVLLPEHLHCLWQLPYGDTDYSTRWGLRWGLRGTVTYLGYSKYVTVPNNPTIAMME